METVFLNSINDIHSDTWNHIVDNDYPFIKHEFLTAMEASESACSKTGWKPQHLVVYEQNTAVAVMPLYLKSHSYGEYIFDWSWANAYQHYGLEYYPKLLSSIPFTPATGPRLSLIDTTNKAKMYSFVATQLQAHARKLNASSIHILLPEKNETKLWSDHGLITRATSQFHWFNNQHHSFEDFLSTFSSRKRKNVKKERQRIIEQGISLHRYLGEEINTEIWDYFYYFYQLTYAKRSGHAGYLRRDFFTRLSETMPKNILLVMAKHQDRYIAGALYFFSSNVLYGRYWGCAHEFEMLHFELCYYQGIEFCINNDLKKFDAGAQGEHKIQRGFTPTTIWSNHWIKNSQFSAAINDYIENETQNNTSYIESAKNHLPFKKN